MKSLFQFSLLILVMNCYSQNETSPFIATFGGQFSGYMTKENISKTDSLVLFCSDSKYNQAKIVSFTISPLINGVDISISNKSNKVDNNQRKELNRLPINQKFYIESIEVKSDSLTFHTNNSIELIVDGPSACIFKCPDTITKSKMRIDTGYIYIHTEGKGVIFATSIISKEIFLANKYLFYRNPKELQSMNGEVDIRSQIIQYNCTLRHTDNEKGSVDQEFVVNGDQISNEIKKAVSLTPNLDFIRFDNIKAKNKDGSIVEIGSLKLVFEDCFKYY